MNVTVSVAPQRHEALDARRGSPVHADAVPETGSALAAAADSRKDARRDRAKVASGWEGDS